MKVSRKTNGGGMHKRVQGVLLEVHNDKEKVYFIHTSTKWSCIKNIQNANGKDKKYAHWYRAITCIIGKGSGYSMLLGKSITHIKNNRQKYTWGMDW